MPLDLRYLEYCQPGNPFYAPAVVDDVDDEQDPAVPTGDAEVDHPAAGDERADGGPGSDADGDTAR